MKTSDKKNNFSYGQKLEDFHKPIYGFDKYETPKKPEEMPIDYYSDFYEDDTNNIPTTSIPFESDLPSFWTNNVPIDLEDMNIISSQFNERDSVVSNERNGHEISSNDNKYRYLMMDRNLTPNDKIQFLASSYGDNIRDNSGKSYIEQEMMRHRKYGRNIEHHNEIMRRRKKKRSFEDDVNSKYNGDWYGHLMGILPQLFDKQEQQSKDIQKQQQQQQGRQENDNRNKENINKGRNNDDNKSVSSGRQSNSQKEKKNDEEEMTRSHSIERLCFQRKCALAIPSKKEMFFTEARKCLDGNSSKHQHIKVFATLCGQEHLDYILVPYALVNKYDGISE